MIIDRSHKKWIVATLLLLAAATATYVNYVMSSPAGPTGGSTMGLVYGVIGSALMIFAGLITARKKFPRWRIGSAQAWLRAHIWLGSLSVPIILFHAGFHLGGAVEQALWLVLALIVASGVFGLAVQQFLTRDLTARVPLETFFDQVPHVCSMLQLEGDIAVSALCGPLPVEPVSPETTRQWLVRFKVSGRDPLPTVYRVAASAAAATAEEPAPAKVRPATVKQVKEPTPAEPKAATAGSAADKIAAMRAAKAGAGTAAPTGEQPGAGKALSAADKVAAMRAAKKTTRPDDASPATADVNASEPSAVGAKPAPAAGAMSAADKIAAMRAAKAGAKPAEPVADTAAPAAGASKDAKSMTPAEKIAAMRAAKSGGTPNQPAATTAPATDATAPSAATTETAAPPAKDAKSMTPAEKIAAMRAAKATAQPAAAPTTAVPPAESSPAAPTAASDASKGPKSMSPAEKIAAMRAAKVGSPAAAPPEQSAAAATSTTEPAKDAKSMSPAEKIAAMRAAKAGVALVTPPAAVPTVAEPGDTIAPTTDAATPAKPMTPAEKIAAMRAGKPTVASAATKQPAEPIAPLSAGDKIAAMRAKSAAPAASGAATATAEKPAAVRPVPAARPAKPSVQSDAWKQSSPELQRFYLEEVRPFFEPRFRRDDDLAHAASAAGVFGTVRGTLPAELQGAVDRLAALCDERRQLATEERIYFWLHGWQYVHVPLSWALLVLGLAHVWKSLYY